ncbi:MAG: hypothetical protein FWG34_10125 [Oscillospiraceae bacterium]|nr:hypothetical protein [Oscillospiraceae bacterium]
MEKTANDKSKPTFDSIISNLPDEFRNEIIETDSFLKSLRPMKFKRVIDKNGSKITYVASDFGISYALKISGGQFSHNFWWYIIHKGKPETWHRKADYMEETLVGIAQNDMPLSERIFNSFKDCTHCYGEGCLAKTLYEFNGQKKLTCHGRVNLNMCKEDFHDVREFFRRLNVFMERKTASGELPPDKIILANAKRSL